MERPISRLSYPRLVSSLIMTGSFSAPTRFGNMSGQIRSFLDQTGGLWAKGVSVGKAASGFTSTGTGGGQETT